MKKPSCNHQLEPLDEEVSSLIKDIEPIGPNHIWVSDITYWKTKGGHYYISFITDAYSRKIVVYHVADMMEAIESATA